jgi:hypothetical protein
MKLTLRKKQLFDGESNIYWQSDSKNQGIIQSNSSVDTQASRLTELPSCPKR